MASATVEMREIPHIFISDLTHVGDSLSSNVFPLGAGLIAACLKENLGGECAVDVFKYPNDLAKKIEQTTPKVLGFSNYSWNCNLSYDFAKQVKQKFPDVVVVFGGPNYGVEKHELDAFWDQYPLVDFVIVKEGEIAFLELVRNLLRCGFDVDEFKGTRAALANCHYRFEGELVIGPEMPRVKDLNHIPSPYLIGLMDKFFDGVLAPLIHTTRGCPFACTFCSEGNSYYNKVAQRTELRRELEYIAQRIEPDVDLFLSDANFGMFKEDQAKAATIARIQEEYDWPKRLVVSTGKNRKERILKVSALLNGALKITASLQSTDPSILEKIKRSNIATDALSEIAEKSSEAMSESASELILCLPGDSISAHINSLREVIEADVGSVRMYQLIMLPQTELNTVASREAHGLKTKFRPMPRSMGTYEIYGKEFNSIEWEEICVASDTMSFSDYLACRQIDLTVELLHNTGLFDGVKRLCRGLAVSWFDFILFFYNQRSLHSKVLRETYETFVEESQTNLWDDLNAMRRYYDRNMDRQSIASASTNEMANAKASALFKHHSSLHKSVFSAIRDYLAETENNTPLLQQFLDELEVFSFNKSTNILSTEAEYEESFSFDFVAISSGQAPLHPNQYLLDRPVQIRCAHKKEQVSRISAYCDQYGITDDGLTRIVMRAPLRQFYREAVEV